MRRSLERTSIHTTPAAHERRFQYSLATNKFDSSKKINRFSRCFWTFTTCLGRGGRKRGIHTLSTKRGYMLVGTKQLLPLRAPHVMMGVSRDYNKREVHHQTCPPKPICTDETPRFDRNFKTEIIKKNQTLSNLRPTIMCWFLDSEHPLGPDVIQVKTHAHTWTKIWLTGLNANGVSPPAPTLPRLAARVE